MTQRTAPLFTPPSLLDSRRWRGMRVGLLGGSFNPPHNGHIHISRIALQIMRLDCVWWLVTPQNPFKPAMDMRPYEERMEMCRARARHPKIVVTDIESTLPGTRSVHTVRALSRHFPETRFAWITGMDVALEMHQWFLWRRLLDTICTVHICRPPALSVIRGAPLRALSTQTHCFPDNAGRYPLTPNTTYWILQRKMLTLSSTKIRNAEKNTTEK